MYKESEQDSTCQICNVSGNEQLRIPLYGKTYQARKARGLTRRLLREVWKVKDILLLNYAELFQAAPDSQSEVLCDAKKIRIIQKE